VYKFSRIFQKYTSYLKIQIVREAKWSKFHIKKPQISGAHRTKFRCYIDLVPASCANLYFTNLHWRLSQLHWEFLLYYKIKLTEFAYHYLSLASFTQLTAFVKGWYPLCVCVCVCVCVCTFAFDRVSLAYCPSVWLSVLSLSPCSCKAPGRRICVTSLQPIRRATTQYLWPLAAG